MKGLSGCYYVMPQAFCKISLPWSTRKSERNELRGNLCLKHKSGVRISEVNLPCYQFSKVHAYTCARVLFLFIPSKSAFPRKISLSPPLSAKIFASLLHNSDFFCNFADGLSSFHFGRHSVSNLCKNCTSSNPRKNCDS